MQSRPLGSRRPILRRVLCGLQSQRGASLVSQLVGLAIIGVTLAIFAATLFTGGRGTVVVHQEVNAQNYARQQMEAIKNAPYAMSYSPVATSSTYSINITAQELEDGLQKVTIQVYAAQPSEQLLCTLEGYKRRST